MNTSPSVRLHFGASHDDIMVDGHTFVRHQLTRKEFSFIRNVVIDALIKVGSIKRRAK